MTTALKPGPSLDAAKPILTVAREALERGYEMCGDPNYWLIPRLAQAVIDQYALLTEANRLILAVESANPADYAECVARWMERIAALEEPNGR